MLRSVILFLALALTAGAELPPLQELKDPAFVVPPPIGRWQLFYYADSFFGRGSC